ncbi:MAG: hypothetical protein H8K04_09540 [Nitrospira sp.]
MFDHWSSIGVVAVIGLIVVGFSAFLGRLITKLFSGESDVSQTSQRAH